MSEPSRPSTADEGSTEAKASQPAWDDPRPGDTYLEGPYVVFTEQYHLRRGYCCNSGCRHCPYK